MRPTSIAAFEGFYLLAILVEVVRLIQQWSLVSGDAPADRWGRVAAVAISLLLVLLTSRARKRVAAFVLAALFIIGFPLAAGMLMAGGQVLPLAVQIALQVAAFLMLLRPESRAWFSSKGKAGGRP